MSKVYKFDFFELIIIYYILNKNNSIMSKEDLSSMLNATELEEF